MLKRLIVAIVLLWPGVAFAQATTELCVRATPTGFCQAVDSTRPLPVTATGTSGVSLTLPGGGAAITNSSAGSDARSNTFNSYSETSFGMVFNGSSWDRIRSPASALDGSTGLGVQTTSAMIFNGATYDRNFTCSNSAIVNVTAATTEIVALTAGQTIRVCSFTITGSAVATLATFVYGTGANCATGITSLTGVMRISVDGNIALSAGQGSLFRTASANALCLTAATGAVTGFVTYAKF